MALLYRAIWEDDRANLLDEVEREARRWLADKGVPLEAGVDDAAGEYVDVGGETVAFEVTTWRATVPGVAALRLHLVEQRDERGQRWTTDITSLTNGEPGGTIWVDVDRESQDPFTRPLFGAPRIVTSLIESGIAPRVGHVRLEGGPKVIEVDGLAGLIRNEDRRLPVVVFAHDRRGPRETLARAEAAYRRLAGVAQVFVLPEESVEAFKESVGEELAVWGGGARLYLPNRGPGGLNPGRHRYVTGAKAALSLGTAGEVFASLLSTTVPATPPPPAFTAVRAALTSAKDPGLEAALVRGEEELRERDAALQELREQVAVYSEESLELKIENEELNGQLNALSGEVSRLRPLAGKASSAPAVVELPDAVSTIREALELATKLFHLEIHPDAPIDIEKLDRDVASGAWANTIWRGLRALDAYASGEYAVEGGLWEWCRAGLSPWTWPASAKKLAMTESEGVLNDPRLRGKRLFPVSDKVTPGGRIEMLSHLKIAEGGGPIAPRLYFLDDTAGATGKVHIGFIGPHEHVPNQGRS